MFPLDWQRLGGIGGIEPVVMTEIHRGCLLELANFTAIACKFQWLHEIACACNICI